MSATPIMQIAEVLFDRKLLESLLKIKHLGDNRQCPAPLQQLSDPFSGYCQAGKGE